MQFKYATCLMAMLALTMVANGSTPDDKVFYKGMLGGYGTEKEFPFYLLSAPDGSNVWGDVAMMKLNGKWDMDKQPREFSAIGHFYIPAKTPVKIDAGRAVSVFIDDKLYALANDAKPNGRVVEMAAGLHVIKLRVGNNGGQLPGCSIKLSSPSGMFEAPIFFTKSELDKFVAKYPKGSLELSDWDAKSAIVEIKMAK